MNLILLKNFNNYYNRKIIKYDSYLDYTAQYENKILLNINFVPNDGVTTEQIINWDEDFTPDYLVCVDSDNNIESRWFVMEAVRTRSRQYKLSLRRDLVADAYNDLLTSPIYVEKGIIDDPDSPLLLNSEGLQVNQIKTNELLLTDKSKCPWLVGYLKKGFLGSDKASEGVTVNVPGAPGNYVEIATDIEEWPFYKYSKLAGPTAPKMVVTNKVRARIDAGYIAGSGPSFVYTRTYTTMDDELSTECKADGNKKTNVYYVPTSGWTPLKNTAKAMKAAWSNYNQTSDVNKIINLVYNEFENFVTPAQYQQFLNVVNVGRIKDANGKYYIVKYNRTNPDSRYPVTQQGQGSLYTIMSNVSREGLNWYLLTTGSGQPNDEAFSIVPVDGDAIEVILIEDPELNATANFPAETSGTDNPLYDIICMPYPVDGYVTYYRNGTNHQVPGNTNLKVMYSMVKALGGTGGYMLDLQLLPYCPIQSVISNNGTVVVDNLDNVIVVKDNANTEFTWGFIAPKGEFTLDIQKSELDVNLRNLLELNRPHIENDIVSTIAVSGTGPISGGRNNTARITYTDMQGKGDYEINNVIVTSPDARERYQVTSVMEDWTGITVKYTVPNTSAYIGQQAKIGVSITKTVHVLKYDNTLQEDIKVASECDMYRLCSPNYNGIFEFNLMKNNREIKKFNVDCQYKPYNPYIHVNPDFSGLYGQDFDDSRGLVCGGDFSLGIINDAFQAYEIQNKNYQNIFSRQIQNMDVNNAINWQEASWQAIAGTVQGAAAGAAGGMMVGGGYGAAAGAVIGGGTSAIGGALDLQNLSKRQAEARSFAIDNYNYSLQNIQALPASITKTSPITNNNKLFPFIEYYTCTDVEKQALLNKIKYDGMSVGIIDTLENWVSGEAKNFFKGQLIRCDTISEDTHVLEELNIELNKGVYL